MDGDGGFQTASFGPSGRSDIASLLTFFVSLGGTGFAGSDGSSGCVFGTKSGRGEESLADKTMGQLRPKENFTRVHLVVGDYDG